MGEWSLIYGLCYHNFNIKYCTTWFAAFLTKYKYNNYIYIYYIYSIYTISP